MASKTFLCLLLLVLLKTRLSAAADAVKSIYWFSGSEFPVSSIDSSLFTHIFCAFAQVDPATYQLTISAPDAAQFSSFTQTVRQRNPNVKTLLSIGGGSADTSVFAAMASLPSRRKSFIDSSISLARSNNFDGLDLDWEFPSTRTDWANFGTLLVEWRAAAVAESPRRPRRVPLLLTAAVFRSSNYYSIYAPARNITNSLDWINVMAYDFYGPPWFPNFTAPPAGLYNSTPEQVNVNAGIRDWIVSGIPAEKIVLGLPFYGYSWRLTNPSSNGIFAPASGAAISPPVGAVSYGEIRDLVDSSWRCVYNSAIVTDYCYKGTTWIGYDDVRSISTKVQYAKSRGLLGYFAWQVAADSNWILSTTAFRAWGQTWQDI